MSFATRIGFCAVLALAALPASAANFTVNSTFDVKVIASSTGAPCETSCWERWQATSGVGFVMVEKDEAGNVVAAGRLSDAYFYDLYISTDETLRQNLPVAQQITRHGFVESIPGYASCAANCYIAVDFGTQKAVLLGVNSSGKIGSVDALADAVVTPTPSPTPAGECPNNAPGVSCHVSAWGPVRTASGTLISPGTEIEFRFNAQGVCTGMRYKVNGVWTEWKAISG